jgi:hypothetical protein
MSPRKPAAPKPPKPWRRESAGTYWSDDGRFELAGDGAGRWFVRDEAATDELGLPRTTGPFATLADAKAAADTQRAAGAQASPLAGRLDAARSRPRHPSGGEARIPATTSAKRRGTKAELPAKPPPAPRKRTWLDELEAGDPAAARQARDEIRALEDRGIDDADALVRRDRLGGRPVVAERLLALAIRSRVAEALLDAPGSPADRAATAARVVAAVLAAINADTGAKARRLPTWELKEGSTGRRLRPDPEDIAPRR